MPVHGNFIFISWWLLALIGFLLLAGVGVCVLFVWRGRRRPRGFEVLPSALAKGEAVHKPEEERR